jgi:hypothetical protein
MRANIEVLNIDGKKERFEDVVLPQFERDLTRIYIQTENNQVERLPLTVGDSVIVTIKE